MNDLLKELEAVAGLMCGFDRQRFTAELERWFRTHHAEIAEALKDARRYRWLRATRFEYLARNNGDEISLRLPAGYDLREDAAVDSAIDAMHNSAREAGNEQ